MKSLIQILRPYQWLKNVFVFFPLFFGKYLLDGHYWVPSFVVFGAFCFAASGIYCLNDILDAEADRLHPIKRNRPFASGAVNIKWGWGIMLILIFLATFVLFVGRDYLQNPAGTFFLLSAYFIMNILYCFVLKRYAIIDVFIIAIGFVMRVWSGGVASGIWVSEWIILMTFLLSLLLAFAKRRDDVRLYEEKGIIVRGNIVRYNMTFLNQVIGIIASITIVCYILFTISAEVIERFNCRYLYLTSIFVLAGIIRYLQITLVEGKSGSPTNVLYKDKFIHCCIAGWILVYCFILYL